MKIRILWVEYTIKVQDKESILDDCYGENIDKEKTIYIYDTDYYRDRKNFDMYQILFHEIMHAIINETAHDNLFTEKQCEVICELAEKLGKILQDNNYLDGFNK